ncbi:MAG TPA: hypothetical protein VF300_01920, partial [Methanothrix sp.]
CRNPAKRLMRQIIPALIVLQQTIVHRIILAQFVLHLTIPVLTCRPRAYLPEFECHLQSQGLQS